MEKKVFLEKMMNLLDLEEEPTMDASLADFEDWDSLAQIRLIVAIEKHFRIKFATADIVDLENVGDMVKLIERNEKLAATVINEASEIKPVLPPVKETKAEEKEAVQIFFHSLFRMSS